MSNVANGPALSAIADLILAAQLGDRRLDGRFVAKEVDGPSAAYAVQRLVAKRAANTIIGQVAGYKIGMSSIPIQTRFDLSEPILGRVFAQRLLETGAALHLGRDQRVGVECEIAATITNDMRPQDTPYNAVSAAQNVLSIHTGIEIIEDRFENMPETPVWALAADNMLGAGGVVGSGSKEADRTLDRIAQITLDEKLRETGSSGGLAYGGPMGCLAWLANRLAGSGDFLRAGEIVFCGGITAPYWIEPPKDRDVSVVIAEVSGLEAASLSINWE